MGTFGIVTLALLTLILVGLYGFSGRLRSTWQWSDPLLREKEELIIDEVLVSTAGRSSTRLREDLYGEIRTAGKVRRVHAHIGYADEELDIGCLISVDGLPVGDDAGKRFYTSTGPRLQKRWMLSEFRGIIRS